MLLIQNPTNDWTKSSFLFFTRTKSGNAQSCFQKKQKTKNKKTKNKQTKKKQKNSVMLDAVLFAQHMFAMRGFHTVYACSQKCASF